MKLLIGYHEHVQTCSHIIPLGLHTFYVVGLCGCYFGQVSLVKENVLVK